MIRGEGKGISLFDARLFRNVNNAFSGNVFLFFPVRFILPFFKD